MIKTYYEQLGFEQSITDEEIQEKYDELESNYLESDDDETFDELFDALHHLLHERSIYDQIIKESSEVISRYHKYYESDVPNVEELVAIVEECRNPIPELFDQIGNLFLDASDYDNSKKYFALYLKEDPHNTNVQFKMNNNSYADPQVIRDVKKAYCELTDEERSNALIIRSFSDQLRGLEQNLSAKELLLDEISNTSKDNQFNYSFLNVLLATYLYADGERAKAELIIRETYDYLAKQKFSTTAIILCSELLEEAGLKEWAGQYEELQEIQKRKFIKSGQYQKIIAFSIWAMVLIVIAVLKRC